MQIREFEVRLTLPGRQNIWALFLLIFSIISFVQGIAATHWMASYRKGDSIIPRKDELTRTGPYLMSEIKTRNAVLVGFSSSDGSLKYKEDAYDVTIQARAVMDLINEYSGRPVAYLLIYKNNPMRQIWGIDVNGIEMLSYHGSILAYKSRDSASYSWFWAFFACSIWFLISILNVQRIRNIG